MLALTLWQPWASLMAIGEKTIETRDWPTDHRGDLAIHAAVRLEHDEEMLCYDEPFFSVLRAAKLIDQRSAFATLPLGKIVAVVRLRDVKSTRWADSLTPGTLPPFETKFGNYGSGRYMWMTDQLRRLREPVACRGMQKLWTVPPEVERQVLAQLEGAKVS